MENHWSEGQSQDVQYTPCIDLSGGDDNGEQQVAPTVPVHFYDHMTTLFTELLS
jgi:hypothetical protein